MSVKRLVGEPREKRLSAEGIMFPVTVPVSAAEGMLAVEDATAVLMRPEISESVAYCERVVVETYPLAEFKNEPSVKVNPPSPSARERMLACCPTERNGVHTLDVAMSEGALRLWYICRKPSAWCGTELVISCPEGSIPSGGCRISTRFAGVLDENIQFAILVMTGSVHSIKWDTIEESPLERAVISFCRFAVVEARAKLNCSVSELVAASRSAAAALACWASAAASVDVDTSLERPTGVPLSVVVGRHPP